MRVSKLPPRPNLLTKAERKRQLREISAIRDSEINTLDISELTAEQMGRAVRRYGGRVRNAGKRQKSGERKH